MFLKLILPNSFTTGSEIPKSLCYNFMVNQSWGNMPFKVKICEYYILFFGQKYHNMSFFIFLITQNIYSN